MWKKTIKGQLPFNEENIWYINTPQGRRDNNGYSAPFPIWWRQWEIKGFGFLIGETEIQAEWINKKLQKEFPQVVYGHSVDLTNAEYNLDITKERLPLKVDWIFCMAVLEHTYDPLSGVRNMCQALKRGGLLCISVPGNGFKQHRRPIDCYRFLEDSLTAFAKVGGVQLLDYAQANEWCGIYRKN